jgi:hypothetical protein
VNDGLQQIDESIERALEKDRLRIARTLRRLQVPMHNMGMFDEGPEIPDVYTLLQLLADIIEDRLSEADARRWIRSD